MLLWILWHAVYVDSVNDRLGTHRKVARWRGRETERQRDRETERLRECSVVSIELSVVLA